MLFFKKKTSYLRGFTSGCAIIRFLSTSEKSETLYQHQLHVGEARGILFFSQNKQAFEPAGNATSHWMPNRETKHTRAPKKRLPFTSSSHTKRRPTGSQTKVEAANPPDKKMAALPGTDV